MSLRRPTFYVASYGPYRANNDLLFYHLDVRVDPEKKFISGKNTIRFKMLKDDNAHPTGSRTTLCASTRLFSTRPSLSMSAIPEPFL